MHPFDIVSAVWRVLACLTAFAAVAVIAQKSVASDRMHGVMPVPSEIRLTEGRLPITSGFRVALTGHVDARLAAAVARITRRWEDRTGFAFPRENALVPAHATLVIDCGGPAPEWPRLGENEAYTLDITPEQARLRADTVTGILRGLETWSQLLASDARGWFVPAAAIRDVPRFPWRGLLIDVSRHWQPIDVIKRQIDGMALVKLNVLHLHLTDDQGFRIESRTHPRLHQLGSDGQFFTHNDIRELLAYAAARGIRIVPEFDMPGHVTSWLVGHPELGSQPGPYQLIRTWGIHDPTLDPTNEAVYALLNEFLGEMAALFPDAYLHIGGDEVTGRHWDANPRIQAFLSEKGLENNAGLQTYFNQRVQTILQKHGKQMVGWDEILQPGLPKDAVIQSWRGADSLATAARGGYSGILSNGYYIDLIHPAAEHYLNDPLPTALNLSAEERRHVLGGEATMWSEWVTPETIDSRIWPRTAAIAERLWSPRDVRDVADMYRRLGYVSQRLEEAGLQHQRYLEPMLRRFAGDNATASDLRALRTFIDLIEPVKRYRRNEQQPGVTQFTPLTGIADCARPDSPEGRALAADVRRLLSGEIASDADRAIRAKLNTWTAAAHELERGLAQRSPRMNEQVPLLRSLQSACGIAVAALEALASDRPPPAGWSEQHLMALDRVGRAHGPVELAIVTPFRWLVVGAAMQTERKGADPAEWAKAVEAAAAKKPEEESPH
jgi:hexosaminidase